MLLTACSSPKAQHSTELYKAPPWPKPVSIQMQSGVAKYITRGHAAYKACVVNLEALEKLNTRGE